jgi:hypothetical protein
MEKEILAYAAGTMDSDGCIQIMQKRSENKNYYSMRVSVSQVTECIPIWLVRNFGGRIDRFISSKERRQPLFRWSIESNKASDFLISILPYLIEKAERAKLGIKFQSTLIYKGFADKLTPDVIEQRIEMYQQMKILNAKHSRKYWEFHNIKKEKELT